MLKACLIKLKLTFFFEITTGDVITPREIEYKYNSIFSNKKINIMAYTIETIIAEKFESIMSKNLTTTRAKDFYDLYMLMNKHKNIINRRILSTAIKNTFRKRKVEFNISNFKDIVEMLKESNDLKNIFFDYQDKLEFAKQVKYENTIKSIKEIIDMLEN